MTTDSRFPSAPDTHVTSFVRLEEDTAICHVGIRKSPLLHKGNRYTTYGLSEVVTHPHYRNRGIASETIDKARRFIMSLQPDISIFTCKHNMVPFYTKCGWEEIPGACLVGGTKAKPFRSDDLNLITMIMFISTKGKLHKADFQNTDIIMELGENCLW